MIDETQKNYRLCFSSAAAGRKVLGHLLIDLGFFDEAKTPEQTALRNYATKLLKNIGVFDIDNIGSFVEKLFEIPNKKGE